MADKEKEDSKPGTSILIKQRKGPPKPHIAGGKPAQAKGAGADGGGNAAGGSGGGGASAPTGTAAGAGGNAPSGGDGKPRIKIKKKPRPEGAASNANSGGGAPSGARTGRFPRAGETPAAAAAPSAATAGVAAPAVAAAPSAATAGVAAGAGAQAAAAAPSAITAGAADIPAARSGPPQAETRPPQAETRPAAQQNGGAIDADGVHKTAPCPPEVRPELRPDFRPESAADSSSTAAHDGTVPEAREGVAKQKKPEEGYNAAIPALEKEKSASGLSEANVPPGAGQGGLSNGRHDENRRGGHKDKEGGAGIRADSRGNTGKEGAETPSVEEVAVFPQRPAIQAGRVGGKYIGPRNRQDGGRRYGDGNKQDGGGGQFTGRHGNYSRNLDHTGAQNGGADGQTYGNRQGGNFGGWNAGGEGRGEGRFGFNNRNQGDGRRGGFGHAGHTGDNRGGDSRGDGRGDGRHTGFGGRPGGFSGGAGENRGGFVNRNAGGENRGDSRHGGFTGRPGGYSSGGENRGDSRHTGFGGRPGGFSGGFVNRNAGDGRGDGRRGPQADGAAKPGAAKPGIKRNIKLKKPIYKHKNDEVEGKIQQSKKKTQHIANPIPKFIEIMEVVSVSELARKMNLKASDLIQKLISMGMMVTINQQIDSETAAILASEYDCEVKIVSLYEQTVIETEQDDENAMMPRPPVVTVMGHVDHGKTKLLDAIRSSDVVSGEFGGITQHIGAYMVETQAGSITFLDTPGHEAFTRMRARGAQVTDIVVLVVAADDGVMPQTIEAINHAKEAGVPIVVAVNKVDKPEANPEKVKSQLSELGLTPEEWGGQTMFVPISAKKKEGIDNLIETVLLQAEILDLKANFNRSAEGKIIESKIDQGRGIVATVMVQKGTLEVGDAFVAGIWPGKVRAIFNDKGKKIKTATPAMPVEVLGFEGIPNAGDPIQVVEDEKIARGYAVKRQELKRFEDAKNVRKITLDNLHDTISAGTIAELKVIIKGDVQGSVEALRSSLEKLSTGEVRLNVIQALPGAINEGDVDLAIASNAILIGFNVRPTPKARSLAEQEKVDIRRYNIIYRVVEEMQLAMEGLLKPDTKEEVIANVEVRQVFKISKSGVVAGCYVQSGTVKRSASVNVIRADTVIYTGKIAGLRRFKDDVREVSSGYECGISIDGFEDVQTGDELEVFEIIEIARKLNG